MDIHEAIRMATTAHEGQVDKTGYHYILHPLRVMLAVSTPDEQIVAVMHDVVEDTDVTLLYLRSIGVPDHLVEAIDGISKRDNESNTEYIHRCKKNPIAKNVKYADLMDNNSPIRMCKLPEKEQKYLRKKYEKSIRELLS